MTTPLVPEVPELPGTSPSAPRSGAASRFSADRAIERTAVLALVLLLGLALVLALPTVPAVWLVPVTVLLLVSVAALARDTAPGDGTPVPTVADGSRCGLEGVSGSLRCHRSAGHTGTHYDARAGLVFTDTLAAHIGDAGAYYLDRQGRPVPVDEAF